MTVDDLQASFQAGPDTDAAFDAPDRAFRTASWLHDEEVLEFVVAPLRDDDGIVIRRLSERDRPWASGPYAEPVRWLLQANAGDLQRRLQEYDELASKVRESSEPWVVIPRRASSRERHP